MVPVNHWGKIKARGRAATPGFQPLASLGKAAAYRDAAKR
jgi:hypothetical protein